MRRPQRASSSGQDNDQVLDEPVPDDHVVTIDEEFIDELHARTERFHYLDISVSLYQAALKGDWQVAKALFEKYSDVFRRPITEGNETALHIAVLAESVVFVTEVLKFMTRDDLALQNIHQNTALSFAAGSGIVSIAKVMVERNNELPLIRGSGGKTPLYLAALNGRRNMVSYLYPLTPFEYLVPIERIDILVASISTDMYDIALDILRRDRTLATMENSFKKIALQELARKPFAIGSRSQLSIWETCLNNSWFKGMCNKALMQTSAHELVKLLWREILILPKDKFEYLFEMHSSFLFKAAELGNIEYLIILIRSYPDLIWRADKRNRSIFHVAVKYRQVNVFNLIYEIGAFKGIIAQYVDKNNNSMLHLAGELAPLDQLNSITGAFLQMERELQWFKEIEKIVPPSYKKMRNTYQEGQRGVTNQDSKDGEDMKMVNLDGKDYENKDQYFEVGVTPWELFTKEHKELKEQGEKWMKDTSNNCMLVATLIATVVFTATFTVPGGNNQETGTPIFLKSKWFTVFCVSDALALVSSSISILTFLSIIITSRYTEEDFLNSLPIRLLFALTTLFISIASMVVAFSAAYFLVYYRVMTWLPIVIIASASIPVALFVVLHYKLWVDIFRSTCRSKILFRPDKRMLF